MEECLCVWESSLLLASVFSLKRGFFRNVLSQTHEFLYQVTSTGSAYFMELPAVLKSALMTKPVVPC